MPCTFPVWYAAGLPGCKKLITDFYSDTAGVPLGTKTHIDYKLNAAGDIETATRSDYNGEDLVLVRVYKFSYK